jgi:hypothetical protein
VERSAPADVRVHAVELDRPEPEVAALGGVAVEQRGEGVRLLARGAPRAPDAQRRLVTPPERRDHVARERGEHLPVAEEARDADGQRVEQQIVLAAVAVEQARVVGIRVHAARAHAHGDAALEAPLLVTGGGEPPLA